MVAVITRIIVAVVTLSFMISGNYYNDFTADYFKRLNKIDVYENSTLTAIPAKNVHDIIEDHFASELPEGKKVKKAVFIGYDGVRADVFGNYSTHDRSGINSLISDAGHAYLSYAGGINFPYYNIQATDSAPGWTTMLTGELYYKTGVLWNDYAKNDEYPTLMKSLIDDNLAGKTACYSSWGGYLNSTLKSEIESTKEYNTKYIDAAQYVIDGEFSEKYEALDTAVTRLAVSDIQEENCSDFIFALFESTDNAGHSYGFHPESEEYLKAFSLEDDLADQIINAVKSRTTYGEEDWLIILSTDHGGFNRSHGYCTAMERYTFIVSNKDISEYRFKL